MILEGLVHQVRPGGRIAVDIGDSNYGGINVPTDKILTEILTGLGASVVTEVALKTATVKEWAGPPPSPTCVR